MHPPSAPLDLSELVFSKSCAVCQLLNWHEPFFLWMHEAVVKKGMSIPAVHRAVNDRLKLWNEKNPENQRPLLMLDTVHMHFRDHIPVTWNDLARISAGWKSEGLIRRGSGEIPEDTAARLRLLESEADRDLLSDLSRISSVVDRVYTRFEQLDKSIGDTIEQTAIPGYTKLASLLTGGLESLIKLRNQDKLLQAALTHFADRFALTAVDLFIPDLRELGQDIISRGHPEIAQLVAVRARDIMVRALTRSAKEAIVDARQNMKNAS